MPLICYREHRFERHSEVKLKHAAAICAEYMRKGYTLTLRQLYYQFVARRLIENNKLEYNNLGSLISNARDAGRIDWEAIEDRTRTFEEVATRTNPSEILRDAAYTFHTDWWADQAVRVEIWVEKSALVGVIEAVARRYRVPYIALIGFNSKSEVWRAGHQRVMQHNANGQGVKILHLGDHDPSGLDMTRDNRERLDLYSEGGDVEVIRVALNYDQVQKYNLPPNFAKSSDSRYPTYIEKYGTDCWELDALDPSVIDELLTARIIDYIDADEWAASKAEEEEGQERLHRLADDWDSDDDDEGGAA